jgi:fission process protein 1
MSSSQPPSSVDSTDTPFRYAAYAQRVRTILLSAHRYVAYTSDIGESFRPVAHPWLVRSAYGISWAYLIGDVGHEGYKAYLRNRRALAPPGDAYKDATSEQILRGMATGNISMPLTNEGRSKEKDSLTPWPTTEISLAEDYRMVMAKRAVFQSIASMGLPAFTIHSVVKYSGRAVKGMKSTLLRTWLPIGVCLTFFFYSSLRWFAALHWGSLY